MFTQTGHEIETDAAAIPPRGPGELGVDAGDFFGGHSMPGIFNGDHGIRIQPYQDRPPVAVLDRVPQQVADSSLHDPDGRNDFAGCYPGDIHLWTAQPFVDTRRP